MATFLSRNVFNTKHTIFSSNCCPFGFLHLTGPYRALHLFKSSCYSKKLLSHHFLSVSSFSELSRFSAASSAVATKRPTIAIRREDVNVWERRAPLSPGHVRQLVRQGFRVLIQPSNRRVFSSKEYERAGAEVEEDVSSARVILGVKQPNLDTLMPGSTLVCFSHTIKAQRANMPLLDAILAKKIRLIDYEKMVDDKNMRLAAFGHFAGIAGMINILHGIGLRLLALGHHTPFMNIGLPHTYRSVSDARQSVRDAGYEIALGNLPASLGPLTFVFTGSGNVSQGAQEILYELPFEMVPPERLPDVAFNGDMNKLYGCIVDRKDHLVRHDGVPYDENHSRLNPSQYYSTFSSRIAPFMSVLVNGLIWSPGDPRLLSNNDMRRLLALRPEYETSGPSDPVIAGCPRLPHRLIAISDVSADPGGSLEFMTQCTTIEQPFELYDPFSEMDSAHAAIATDRLRGFKGKGVLICSIDNMPAQLPREATEYFGSRILPFIPQMATSDANTPFEDWKVDPVIKNATITSNGTLTPNYKYIAKLRQVNESSYPSTQIRRRVLLLGSGYVAGPVVEYLTRDKNTEVTIASDLIQQAEELAKQYAKQATPVALDIEKEPEFLDRLMAAHDIAISLLPYKFHANVLKSCIKHKRHLVTASYVQPAVSELHAAAREANIVCLNEMGLDPGIDHMHALEAIAAIVKGGGRVVAYDSWCGGLPAPECSDNPLRYKFSWSPEGVLLAANNGAKYLQNGKLREVAPGALMAAATEVNLIPGLNLEGVPNRDSLVYADVYGIKSTAHSVLRGTLRYKGYCETVGYLQAIGLFDNSENPLLAPSATDTPANWPALLARLIGSGSAEKERLHSALKSRFQSGRLALSDARVERALAAFEELGLFDYRSVVTRRGSALRTLAAHLNGHPRLTYGPGERDLVILTHRLEEENSRNGGKVRKVHERQLIVYGDAQGSQVGAKEGSARGFSAMAKTVGLPAAIAARLLSEGAFDSSGQKGVVLPTSPAIYAPILERLAAEGLAPLERVTERDV